MTQKTMESLQSKFAGYPDVLLISINIYPGHDTQSIIAQYARDHHADPARWLFLHGGKEDIYALVQSGFKQGLGKIRPRRLARRSITRLPSWSSITAARFAAMSMAAILPKLGVWKASSNNWCRRSIFHQSTPG